MGFSGPTTPFPDDVAEFRIPLPLPVPSRIGPDITELICTATKVDERGYTKDGHSMFAAVYSLDTNLGSRLGGLLTNSLTQKVPASLNAILHALASYLALKWSYEQQPLPHAIPPNPGLGSPFKREMGMVLDGTVRFRGFCAGIAALDPALVATVDIGFDPVWAKEKPPA